MSKYDKLRDRPRPRVNRLFKATNILLSIYIEPHIYIIRYDLNPSSLPIPMGETSPLFYNTAQNVTLIRYPPFTLTRVYVILLPSKVLFNILHDEVATFFSSNLSCTKLITIRSQGASREGHLNSIIAWHSISESIFMDVQYPHPLVKIN